MSPNGAEVMGDLESTNTSMAIKDLNDLPGYSPILGHLHLCSQANLEKQTPNMDLVYGKQTCGNPLKRMKYNTVISLIPLDIYPGKLVS